MKAIMQLEKSEDYNGKKWTKLISVNNIFFDHSG